MAYHPSRLVGWLVGFYAISTFIGYLTPNTFYANNQFYFKNKSQFSMNTQFNCQKKILFQAIQFTQIVLIQTIPFSTHLILFNP